MKIKFKLAPALILYVCLNLWALPAQAVQVGDSFATWVKLPVFKKLYVKALGKSPVNHANSWVFRDIGFAKSTAFAGENSNTWIHLVTCASKLPESCRQNHIDVFYDVQNQELFAYLIMGNRVGWIGGARNPTSLEQKFFLPRLTAKNLR